MNAPAELTAEVLAQPPERHAPRRPDLPAAAPRAGTGGGYVRLRPPAHARSASCWPRMPVGRKTRTRTSTPNTTASLQRP